MKKEKLFSKLEVELGEDQNPNKIQERQLEKEGWSKFSAQPEDIQRKIRGEWKEFQTEEQIRERYLANHQTIGFDEVRLEPFFDLDLATNTYQQSPSSFNVYMRKSKSQN